MLGANMSCIFFVALRLKVSLHFLQSFAHGRPRRFERPRTFGASPPLKILRLRPDHHAAHGHMMGNYASNNCCRSRVTSKPVKLQKPARITVCSHSPCGDMAASSKKVQSKLLESGVFRCRLRYRHREYPQPPPPSKNNTTTTISMVSISFPFVEEAFRYPSTVSC